MRFLRFIAALSILCSPAAALAVETLYFGGEVFTGEGDAPAATWFLVRDGRIAAVGDGQAIPQTWAGVERQVDLAGAFVMPGLIDPDVHFIDGGLGLMQADLSQSHSEAALIEAIDRAERRAGGEWILGRGFAGKPVGEGGEGAASLADLQRILVRRGPAFVALAEDDRAYVNEAGRARLAIGAARAAVDDGVDRDAAGTPTGLLSGKAAWSARRAIHQSYSPALIARAILAAQRRALAFGITAIGDNTFFPAHLIQYQRLSAEAHFHLRVAARSFGSEPATRSLMASAAGPRIRFAGERYYVDDPALEQERLEEILLFATSGATFHVEGREAADRLVMARRAVAARRPPGVVDVVDHCGGCGGAIAEGLREAGFRVIAPPAEHPPLRALFDAGLQPALSSAWPYGATSDAGFRASVRQTLAPLSQAAIATHAAGADRSSTMPLGAALRGITSAAADTIGWSELGRIRPGSRADFVVLDRSPFGPGAAPLHEIEVDTTFIGGVPVYRRSDTPEGRALRAAMIRADAAGAVVPDAIAADPAFGIAGTSDGPASGRAEGSGSDDAQPALGTSGASDDLASGRAEGDTAVDAETVFDGLTDREASEDAAIAARFGSRAHAWTPAPIVGYESTVGWLLGGALFVHPYEDAGWKGGGYALFAPEQGTFQIVGDIQRRRAFGPVAAHLLFRFETFRQEFFGIGNETHPDPLFQTEPLWIELQPGVRLPLGQRWEAGLYVNYAWLDEGQDRRIIEAGSAHAGVVSGSYWGPRLELAWDGRDNPTATRKGTHVSAWTDAWLNQGSEAARRLTFGARIAHFVPLRAPDWILAMRLEGGASVGERGYLTDFKLGGANRLRGYSSNRFRGDHAVDATVELRFPIWRLLSGVVFADGGRVWVTDLPDHDRTLSLAGGGGLRLGLPPGGQTRLRFDVGAGRDETTFFFTFGEAF